MRLDAQECWDSPLIDSGGERFQVPILEQPGYYFPGNRVNKVRKQECRDGLIITSDLLCEEESEVICGAVRACGDRA